MLLNHEWENGRIYAHILQTGPFASHIERFFLRICMLFELYLNYISLLFTVTAKTANHDHIMCQIWIYYCSNFWAGRAQNKSKVFNRIVHIFSESYDNTELWLLLKTVVLMQMFSLPDGIQRQKLSFYLMEYSLVYVYIGQMKASKNGVQ